MSYLEQKEKARQKAIDFQIMASEKDLYMSDYVRYASYFEKLGKRYGLLKEFRENGII